jgi:DMSO/TMAO reductase YedYZ molybdopterin-dependent catalytic subunit
MPDHHQPGVRMTDAGFSLRMPPRGLHSLTERITDERDVFVVTHMGLAEIDPASWYLVVDGMVQRELRLTLADLQAMPQHEVMSVHECAGSPLTPTEPKRRVGNVVWLGVRLANVLDMACVNSGADFVWSEGLEWVEFVGMRDEPFIKDLPLAKALTYEVLLALSIKGSPLKPDRGGPVRLVVPGWYGTNSVKWLGRLHLAQGRAPGPFTTRFYNDPTPDGPKPVWGIAPESIIVLPAPDAPPSAGVEFKIEGWTWGDAAIAMVEVSTDGGVSWQPAELETGWGFAWQKFRSTWAPSRGHHALLCRCTDINGRSQPRTGARNAVHQVIVEIA